MPKNLVIVESPAKAKTIQKYLGKDFFVKSSYGHIRDLPKKGLSIDIEHDFKPTYEINPDKKKVVAELKKAAASADKVWLASDEDREGEAIAWHLTEALGLKPANTKRIVFHEITKQAIENAIKNPRDVDLRLVNAQQARRVLDRLVGYELSPVLWKKIRTGLSAGRVQSVAVRLCIDREREIKVFKPEDSFRVLATFKHSSADLRAELEKKLKAAKTVHDFLEDAKGSDFTVINVDKKPGNRSPSPPFITSTLQQDASRQLGYSVRQTMNLAQRLYEAGHITYMRTDSTTLSGEVLAAAQKYILDNFGSQYYYRRQFQTKDSTAQEAHEAIRPTNFKLLKAGEDQQQERLYRLIWQRALATQMAPAKIETTQVNIKISKRPELLQAKGEVLVFDGFMKISDKRKDDTILPPLTVGEKLNLVEIVATETYSRPPARYSEATLVRKLEELGIGRPSTYAPTISTIQTRGYIEKKDLEGEDRTLKRLTLKDKNINEDEITEKVGADRNKLIPTQVAEITTDFLFKYFADILSYDFTARVEDGFDKIADGKEEWEKMIANFYKGFHPLLTEADKASRKEVSQARLLGKDPVSKLPIFARFGRYGPMLQKGDAENEDKPSFAPMPEGVTLDEITLGQALPMFALPRIVGKTEDGEEIEANIGRFGPYIKVNKTFVSIKPLDPYKITEKEARKLYKAKLKKEADKYFHEFNGGIKVVNGPYGPYITDGKSNVKMPKGENPKTITEAKAKAILKNPPPKKNFRRRSKK
jgi:DNA topoisomerase-1